MHDLTNQAPSTHREPFRTGVGHTAIPEPRVTCHERARYASTVAQCVSMGFALIVVGVGEALSEMHLHIDLSPLARWAPVHHSLSTMKTFPAGVSRLNPMRHIRANTAGGTSDWSIVPVKDIFPMALITSPQQDW